MPTKRIHVIPNDIPAILILPKKIPTNITTAINKIECRRSAVHADKSVYAYRRFLRSGGPGLEDGCGNLYFVKDGKVKVQITEQESRHEKLRDVYKRQSNTFTPAQLSEAVIHIQACPSVQIQTIPVPEVMQPGETHVEDIIFHQGEPNVYHVILPPQLIQETWRRKWIEQH